jgi:hypothetical protein
MAVQKVCRPIFKRPPTRLPAPHSVLSGSLKRMSRWPNRRVGPAGKLRPEPFLPTESRKRCAFIARSVSGLFFAHLINA